MDRLNLVLTIFDTARRDHFGCYGYPRRTTPVVDEFARDAWIYDRMVTPAPWTVPSHGSLFTGLYPREHGAHFPVPVLRKDAVTLARHLRDHGYTTVCITANALLSRTGLTEGFQLTLQRKDVEEGNLQRRARFVLGLGDRGSGAIVRYVDRFLGDTRPPFFLFLNLIECHWPYFPLRRFERKFVRQSWPSAQSVWRRLRDRGSLPAWEAIALATDERTNLLRDLYDAGLATVDERFGLLLEAVTRHGREADTVVILTSDHGENIGDHGLATHQGSLHQTLVHVPFIARVPGQVPRRIPSLVQFTDIFGGLCRTLGVEPPEHLNHRPDTVDPFAMTTVDGGRPYAFAEWQSWDHDHLRKLQSRSPHYDLSAIPMGLEAVQDQRFKMIVRLDTGAETLHDLTADPGETRDVASDHPEEVRRLRGALMEWRMQHPDAPQTTYTLKELGDLEARLRDLGYM